MLNELAAGDESAYERLVPLVYDELRSLAGRLMKAERSSHTLEPTALVNELLIRILGAREPGWEDRRHFLAAAAGAMRRLLVDHARRRGAIRRGQGWQRVTLTDSGAGRSTEERAVELLALNEALARLESRDPRQARIVELRYFGGLSVAETAAELGVSERTVKADWAMARAWLFGELGDGKQAPSPD